MRNGEVQTYSKSDSMSKLLRKWDDGSLLLPTDIYDRVNTIDNILIFHFIVDYLKGIKKIWVLSDDFGLNSFNEHFCLNEENDKSSYMKENFEISGFMNNKAQSHDVNTASRIRSCLAGAIKDQKIFPKCIVVILDHDVIKYFHSKLDKKNKKYTDPSEGYEVLIKYLIPLKKIWDTYASLILKTESTHQRVS